MFAVFCSDSTRHAQADDTKTSDHQTKDRVLQSTAALASVLRLFAAAWFWKQTNALRWFVLEVIYGGRACVWARCWLDESTCVGARGVRGEWRLKRYESCDQNG